ncbi:MAG: lipid-binding SYLF domain-containing protein [Phycisphaeraceae bacterium]
MFRSVMLAVTAGLLLLSWGCSTEPKTEAKKEVLHEDAQQAIKDFKTSDPSLQKLFDSCYGYAIFPEIGKGAIGVGGAYGHGEVYQGRKFVGYCNMSQGSIGFQLGGQTYSELILFQNKAAFDEFCAGDYAFAAQASAVAAKAGASATADYERGVMVFTMAQGGLMYEASVGGQKFTFKKAE